VPVMKECWQNVLARLRRPILRVDLTGVTAIDAIGKSCLIGLCRQGAEFVATDCLTKAVVGEITGAAFSDCGRANGNGGCGPLRNRDTT
jgi:hypothetical protein